MGLLSLMLISVISTNFGLLRFVFPPLDFFSPPPPPLPNSGVRFFAPVSVLSLVWGDSMSSMSMSMVRSDAFLLKVNLPRETSEARRIFNGAGGRRASQRIENNVSLVVARIYLSSSSKLARFARSPSAVRVHRGVCRASTPVGRGQGPVRVGVGIIGVGVGVCVGTPSSINALVMLLERVLCDGWGAWRGPRFNFLLVGFGRRAGRCLVIVGAAAGSRAHGGVVIVGAVVLGIGVNVAVVMLSNVCSRCFGRWRTLRRVLGLGCGRRLLLLITFWGAAVMGDVMMGGMGWGGVGWWGERRILGCDQGAL